jgi:hypothetical protein
MIRIYRCLKKEFAVGNSTRIFYTKVWLLLVLNSLIVSGCGNDPGPEGEVAIASSPTKTVFITSTNAEDIVNTVFSRSALFFDVVERLFTALPDDRCPFGGSATIEIKDAGIAGRGEPGDSVRRMYTDCVFSDPIFKGSFDGEVMIEITQSTGDLVLDQQGNIYLGMNEDSSAATEVAVDSFRNTELDETTGEAIFTTLGVQGSASRELNFIQREFEHTDRSKGRSLTISRFDIGSVFRNFDMLCKRLGTDNQTVFSIDASLSAFVVPTESSSDIKVDGSNAIGGFSTELLSETLEVKTTTNFTALSNLAPDSGQMIIEGAQRSVLVLTALGPNSVRVQVDANGDGDFTDSDDRDEQTTWTAIGVDFQGFCVN